MNIKQLRIIYKCWVGISSAYLVSRMLDKKTEDLVTDGGAVNAFTIGAGEAGISIAAGIVVATIVDSAFR